MLASRQDTVRRVALTPRNRMPRKLLRTLDEADASNGIFRVKAVVSL